MAVFKAKVKIFRIQNFGQKNKKINNTKFVFYKSVYPQIPTKVYVFIFKKLQNTCPFMKYPKSVNYGLVIFLLKKKLLGTVVKNAKHKKLHLVLVKKS